MKRFALLLLPTALRKPLVAAFVQSAVQGCNILYGDFMRWRDERNYRLEHNGQVCYLRAVLNDMFDRQKRRIRIDDGERSGRVEMLLHLRGTGRHILLPLRADNRPLVLNRRGYSGAGGYDFWVTFPEELRGQVNEVRLAAVVDKYKLASRRWTIDYD